MKNSIIIIGLVLFSLSLHAQDSLMVSCPDSMAQLIKVKSSYTLLTWKGGLSCDSIYFLSARQYQQMQRELRASKGFVQLYKFYREEVKKGDQEVSSIVDGYEKIIKTKDEAYNKLMDEYTVLNHLLDSSITQTGAAVDLSKKSLTSLQGSLDTMQETNEHLRKDLTDLQKLNRRSKWQYGIGGFALGVLIGFLITK